MSLEVWPTLPLGAWTRSPLPSPPFPLGDAGCRIFARARHGLWHAVRAAGLRPGDRLLVPAYHHGSEVEALSRAGLDCVFYRLDDALAPDAAHLDAVCAGARALHIVHYLGFPQDALRWRAWTVERGMLLIEDAAQAWLATRDGVPAGSVGDIAIFCAYKSFGVPDGGLVRSASPLPAASAAPPAGAVAALRHHAPARALAGAVHRMRDARSGAVAETYDSARDFALGDPDAAASRATQHLLPRLAAASAAERRRANYRVLLSRLPGAVAAPWAALPEGASPMAFPVRTGDKRALLQRLHRRGVDALDLWSTPHPLLPADLREATAALRASVVGLPVHQELSARDLDRIAAAMP